MATNVAQGPRHAISAADWVEGSKLNGFHLRTVVACLILNSMEGYDVYVYGTALPLLLTSFGMSATQAGSIGSVAQFGTLIGALVLGPLADKVGRRRVILGSVLLSCASMAVAGMTSGYGELLVTRFFFGIANGALAVNIMALMSESVPKSTRATLVGLVASGASVGGLIGAALGIWVFPRYGWRPVFFGASSLILLFPLYRRWLPEAASFLARNGRLVELRGQLRRSRPGEPLSDRVAIEAEVGGDKAPLSDVFRNGRTLGTLLFWLCYTANLFVIQGFSLWIPQLMVSRGFSLSKSLAVLFPLAIASIVMTFVAGRIADRIGGKPVLITLYIVSCVSIYLIGLSHDYGLLLVLVGLAGVGFNGAQNMINGYAPIYYPGRMRSTAMGYNFVFGRVGGILGPLVVGMLVTGHVSQGAIMTALAAPSVVAAIAMWRIPERFSHARRHALMTESLAEPSIGADVVAEVPARGR